jgi:hypothetical protein
MVEPNESLQFDKAEPSTNAPIAQAPATSCTSCAQPFTEPYYRIGGHAICAVCKTALEQRFGGTGGTKVFLRATLWGTAGAALGSGIYYAVREATGYELGLIAVVVGFLVGAGVRKASGARGGRVYQGLAILLTYIAIGTTYLPAMYQGLRSTAAKKPDVKTGAVKSASAAEALAADAEGGLEGGTASSTSGAATSKSPGKPMHPILALAGMLVIGLLGALAAPILVATLSPLSLVFLGIAIYEAWKLNKRPALVFTGPIDVSF